MKSPNLDEKVCEYNWRVFFGPKDGGMYDYNASPNFK